MKKLKEADILKACQDLLDAERIPWYRMNSGKIILRNGNGSRRCIKLNPEGTPDLLFHWDVDQRPQLTINNQLPVAVTKRKLVIWVEVKRPGETITKAQVAFGGEAVRRGEIILLVTDVRELQDWLRTARSG